LEETFVALKYFTQFDYSSPYVNTLNLPRSRFNGIKLPNV